MSIVFDRAATFYDQTRGLPEQAERWLAQVVREHTPLRRNSRVLEVGIGTGRIALPLIRENSYRYVGVDLSRAMMNALRDKAGDLPVLLAQADIARLPLPDGIFDAVVAVHIFHLVSEWPQAMDEIGRVLRAGGVLLHGGNNYSEHAPMRLLRQKLDELAQTNDNRRTMRLIDRSDLQAQLEQRFGPAETVATPAWQVTQTAREMLELYRRRAWSFTWSLSDEVLSQALEAAAAWVYEQFGSLDTPLVAEQYFSWTIYQKRSGD